MKIGIFSCFTILIPAFIMIKNRDWLALANQKSIIKALEEGEGIVLSSNIIKINDHKKHQQRSILITTQNFYNLKSKEIRRKIPLSKIGSLTVSRLGPQFVINVVDQYDYRFMAIDKKDQIIAQILTRSYNKQNKKLEVFFKDSITLEAFATTKNDKKKNVIKSPHQKGIFMTGEEYLSFVKGDGQSRVKTQTLYSIDEGKVCLQDFNLLTVLGKGAFGMVTLAQKKDTKKLYALKTINKQDIIKKKQLQHTKTQKMILQHINFPFLVNLQYAFQTPSNLNFVMQFMKGGQLFQHLSVAKKFSEERALFYCAEITLALGHLHSKDIIYRDIKLQNVLMDQEGHVSLTDFGMAKILKDDQKATTFCGTPQYLAPQVLQGKGYSKAADWWSLGILLFEMINGLPPFYHKIQQTMYKLISEGQLKFSDKVSISLHTKDLISKLLKKNPDDRLGSKKDSQQIKAHPAFQSMNWDKLLKKQIKTPFQPNTKNWIQNFDKEFTRQEAKISDKPVRDPVLLQKLFKDFT